MKTLLVAEYRQEKLLDSCYELIEFSRQIAADSSLFLVGDESTLPAYPGTIYLADAQKHGEYNPDAHRQLLVDVINREQPDLIVFSHSSYGWDLAPRVAFTIGAGQISEVVAIENQDLVVSVCNAKLRRTIKCLTAQTVVTLQAGAFPPTSEPAGQPTLEKVETDTSGQQTLSGYQSTAAGVDLSKAEVIVSAGRGIGTAENLTMIEALAKALGGELGASRPVVDAEWAEPHRQVGTTGQTVAPKLYVACGISGAIQHLAGMKKSEFIIAINTDRDAPIGEIADVLAVADLKQLVPLLTEKLSST
ncbi:MAG: electron transfer flavoprotein subunit alpha/FixB family protein [Desulfuromonas sp.]|nr:MAG: electron transfer flavoprotein subunit alpha/FixB family protein [Desulfuromonas sp.]